MNWSPPTATENPPKLGCNCARCKPMYFDWNTRQIVNSRFIVCEHCGNKRCPHASWHGLSAPAATNPDS